MSNAPARQLFLLGQQLFRLNDGIPAAERKQHVCGAAFDENLWREIDRSDLCRQMVGEDPPPRVGLVCDAGLGKTTNMEWLQTHLAQRGSRQLPVLLYLNTLRDLKLLEEEFHSPGETPILHRIAGTIFGTADGDTARHLAALKRRQVAGRITLLIDGLDHVSSHSSFSECLAAMLKTEQWRQSPVWIAGRPTAIDGCWHDLFAGPTWQFLRVRPLAEAEIRFYMRENAGGDWYDIIPEASRSLLAIPRLLRLICGILRSAIAEAGDPAAAEEAVRALRLHTPADVYHRAFFHLGDAGDPDSQGLLAQGLRRDAERIGLGEIKPDPTNRRRRVNRTAALLGAIAFRMLDGRSSDGQVRPNFGGVTLDPFQDRVAQRMEAAGQGTATDFGRDFPLLRHMNIHTLDFLLFRESDNDRLAFHDRTVQAFFAAYWACRHATAQELAATRRWVVDPLFDGKLEYGEFWRFAAEMPESAMPDANGEGVDLGRWRELFRPLYDGSVVDAQGRPIRSTEFIYRSWTRMESSEAGRAVLAAYRAGNPVWMTEEQIAGFLPLEGEKPGEPILFTMGAPPDEEGAGSDETEHEATLSPYCLHRCCVTNVEYELFDPRHREHRWGEEKHPGVKASPGSSADDRCPAVWVSWYDAWCFAQWLGEVESTGRRLRVALPSEAQWECACRAGQRTPFTFHAGHDGRSCTTDVCNFDGNYPYPDRMVKGEYRRRTLVVDALGPNLWGFYQMHGNVLEWCEDWYAEDFYRTEGAQECDPVNRVPASARVLRGGGWGDDGWYCRSAYRCWRKPGARYRPVGFRLAAVPIVGAKTSEPASEA